jgi:hypothetical protein
LLDLTLGRFEEAVGRPRYRQQAQALLEEAAATTEELGIQGLGDLAGALLGEVAAPAAPAWPDG